MNPQSTDGAPAYWWDDHPEERSWIEVRSHIEGQPPIGTELRAHVVDDGGSPNAYYELLRAIRHGDRVFHWNSREQRIVGVSQASGTVTIDEDLEPGRPWYRVNLVGFEPLGVTIDASSIAAASDEIVALRDALASSQNGALYLPFQFRGDGLRFISNYFAKMPNSLVDILAGANVPAPTPPGMPPFLGGFLQPFRPKADVAYIAHVPEQTANRSRHHETLVNRFAEWLTMQGFDTARNQAIDLAVTSPSVVIEAKWVNGPWAPAIRSAVGQLYEYRYFQIVAPDSALAALFNERPPHEWIEYLESDRGIGVIWSDTTGYNASPLARQLLGLDMETA